MQHFGFEAADCEGCVVVEEDVEGVREVLLVDAVLRREGRLGLRDALADAYREPWLALFLEHRLEVPQRGEAVGVGVGFEDVGNNVAMFRCLCENIVSGGSAQGAGGRIKIEDGVDDNSLFSLRVCDDILLGAGFWPEDCLDFGLLFASHLSRSMACLQRLLLV